MGENGVGRGSVHHATYKRAPHHTPHTTHHTTNSADYVLPRRPGYSVATTVGVKYYYDMSAKDIGYIESMCLIIRSRFWLFPGILDK